MVKKKQPFIDKKNASTYHLLYRSQRDVAAGGDDYNDESTDINTTGASVILWPSPNNNKEMDHKVLHSQKPSLQSNYYTNPSQTKNSKTNVLADWKQQLSKGGLVIEDYDYDQHLKPITGSGIVLDSLGNRVTLKTNTTTTATTTETHHYDSRIQEVDRQLDSITLTPDCMDEDIAQILFGEDDFDPSQYEELNDEFVLDAAQEPETDESDHDNNENNNKNNSQGFDFQAHIQGLLAKARMESQQQQLRHDGLATVHEYGTNDMAFFSKSKALKPKKKQYHDDDDYDYDEEDDSGYYDETALLEFTTPGVVPKLKPAEEKALCDKFEETLAEYDSDEIGEGKDEEEEDGDDDDDNNKHGVGGLRSLENNEQLEAAMDEFLYEKQDEIFMIGNQYYHQHDDDTEQASKKGGSSFSVLVGTRMIPAKELDKQEGLINANTNNPIRPIEDVLGEADAILAHGRSAPPAEEIIMDGKSYFSEKMKNPWDCESILTTYSNLDNNPMTIQHDSRRRRRQKNNKKKNDVSIAEDNYDDAFSSSSSFIQAQQPIVLSEKTGLPLGVLPNTNTLPHHQQQQQRMDDTNDDTYISVNKGQARSKNESKVEKKQRKQMVKQERQISRMQKKMMKQAFCDEIQKRTQEVLVDDVGGKTVFRF